MHTIMKTPSYLSLSNITRREALIRIGSTMSIATASASILANHAIAQTSKNSGKSSTKVPAGLSPLAAVNVSGRQRSLALRAARGYAQLGLAITPQASLLVVREAVTQFDEAMISLRAYAGKTALAQSLDAIARDWREFSALLREAPNAKLIAEKNALLEKIVSACTSVHDQIVANEKNNNASLVSRAGRQRFLSQRAAQLFMYREWGVARGDYKDIERLSAEYKTVKRELVANALAEQKRDLDLAETQWIFFENALRAQQKGKADDVARRNVATTSERLMEMFDGITNEFVRRAV
jgi:hypothetical protein